jgi:5'-methylthioadenosine phosphorylase
MTLYPEVVLAREQEICYVTVAMVTDYDVWAEKPVTMAEVIETMQRNAVNFKKLVMGALPGMPEEQICGCRDALKYAMV